VNSFRISLQPDWQIDNVNHGGYSNPGVQMRAQDKDFGAVLQMDLTRSFVLSAAQARKN